jgi:hypothetical protein
MGPVTFITRRGNVVLIKTTVHINGYGWEWTNEIRREDEPSAILLAERLQENQREWNRDVYLEGYRDGRAKRAKSWRAQV